MSDHPGIGVMLRHLCGNRETVEAYHAAIGKTIASVECADDTLRFTFSDGSGLVATDQGQSCCESRYMRTDDDLSEFVGATLQSMELKEAPNEPDEYGEHEVQFLEVVTNRGVFTIASHNEHNGYYGGFAIGLESVPVRPGEHS